MIPNASLAVEVTATGFGYGCTWFLRFGTEETDPVLPRAIGTKNPLRTEKVSRGRLPRDARDSDERATHHANARKRCRAIETLLLQGKLAIVRSRAGVAREFSRPTRTNGGLGDDPGGGHAPEDLRALVLG